jgi:hypothetical protein
MKRVPIASVLVLSILAGCAAIVDLPELQAPPAGQQSDSGSDADASEAACNVPGLTNLAVTPRGLHTALDDTDVYFARADPPRDSAILRCSKCGCDKPTELATLNQPGGVAVDDRYVFWTDTQDNGSINRLDKKDPSVRQQVAGQESPLGVAVDDQFVYWTVIGGGPKGVATAGVYRAKKDDLSGVTRLAKSADLPDNIVPYAIAVDETYVYYTTAPDLNDQDAKVPCLDSFGTVRRVLKTGGLQPSEVVASKQPCPVGLALGPDAIYWVNLGVGTALAGSLWTRPKAAGAGTQLLDSLGRPTSLAFHGGRLSWDVPASGRIETCAAAGCSNDTVKTLASEQHNPSGVSADDSGIYWVALGTATENFADGALRRTSTP